MKLILRFGSDLQAVSIPDNFITDVQQLKLDFIDWIYNNPENLIEYIDVHIDVHKHSHYAHCYNSDDFLRYLNEVVLYTTNEKAYYTKLPTSGFKGIPVLDF